MKIYIHATSNETPYGDRLYRATSESGEVLYEHVSSSPDWGRHDVRGGLSRAGYTEGEHEFIDSEPPVQTTSDRRSDG